MQSVCTCVYVCVCVFQHLAKSRHLLKNLHAGQLQRSNAEILQSTLKDTDACTGLAPSYLQMVPQTLDSKEIVNSPKTGLLREILKKENCHIPVLVPTTTCSDSLAGHALEGKD